LPDKFVSHNHLVEILPFTISQDKNARIANLSQEPKTEEQGVVQTSVPLTKEFFRMVDVNHARQTPLLAPTEDSA